MHWPQCVSIVGRSITMSRSYSELILLPTFEERFRYLMLGGLVGESTFGSSRYLNQRFYTSYEWRTFRRDMILRDLGCDLGIDGHDINGIVHLHHLNPLTVDDIVNHTELLLDPENVICTSGDTHKAIHYGDQSYLLSFYQERRPGDTTPWRHD